MKKRKVKKEKITKEKRERKEKQKGEERGWWKKKRIRSQSIIF